MAYVFLPNQAASLATISRADTGRATTIANIQRQVGAAVGVAALGSVLAAAGATAGNATGFTAYRMAFLVAAVLALVGAVSALRVPDEEAAETMQVPAKRSQRGELQTARDRLRLRHRESVFTESLPTAAQKFITFIKFINFNFFALVAMVVAMGEPLPAALRSPRPPGCPCTLRNTSGSS